MKGAVNKSFSVDLDDIAKKIKKAATESFTEEDLRQRVEGILRYEVLDKLEIPWTSWKPPKARYEATLVSGVRPDALYGHVIIEYERPGKFESTSGFEQAIEQVKMYIRKHSQDVEARFAKHFGIVLDGYQIGFVRYREILRDFEKKGPFPVNRNTIARVIEALVGLGRKALSADELLTDFGPRSEVARGCIRVFYNKLLNPKERTKVLFEDWRRVFSQVCAYTPDKLRGLEKNYGFTEICVDVERLLFSLHTYYALIMKLLAAEVASLYVAPRLWSYLRTLEDAYYESHEKLRDELKELEEGGIFAKLGILNFLEADYFAWYLDEWDEQLAKSIAKIIKRLSDYDPSAADLEPDRVKDLFKRIYQNLVPKRIRHDLGEYYTPDWLAELLLDEIGWNAETFEKIAKETDNLLKPLELRLLDPACGSGTFLVLAISRLRKYIDEHWIDKGFALRSITKNIVGFDLNPLAVIASRTNYLIALGDMLRDKGAEPIEIPIYLADSIMVEQRPTVFGTSAYILKTVVGEFIIPATIIQRELLEKILSILQECVKGKYAASEFKTMLLKEVKVDKTEMSLLAELFKVLVKLENEGKNKIWLRILKNSFAPFFVKKFDFVVGNPPWVHWRNLPDNYRKALKGLYEEYGILPRPQYQVNVDLSMLFAYRCMDRYLVDGGRFGFLITQIVFKSFTGEGFLRFRIKGNPLRILKIHDLVHVKPFEGAQNRTAMMIAIKGKQTEYPIPYIIWRKVGDVGQNLPLDHVLKITKRYAFWAEPIGGYKTGVKLPPYASLPKKESLVKLRSLVGPSSYKAHKGVDSIPSSVYWVRIIGEQGRLLTIQNVRRTAKIQTKQVIRNVEKELIFPVIRGRDISKFNANYEHYIIVPHDPTTTRPFSENRMKIDYPKTFAYLKEFENSLRSRADYKHRGKGKPFYFLYRLGVHAMAPYKVVWRDISVNLEAAVVGIVKDRYLGSKIVIPDQTVIFIPFDNQEEAHFVCAILNSKLIRFITKSYHHLHLQPQILNYIKIPLYNPSNPLHRQLVKLSKKAHTFAEEGNVRKLEELEKEIDKTVAKIYNLTNGEIEEIQKTLKLLEGEEIEEEDAEQLPALEPDVALLTPVIDGSKPFCIELLITNPVDQRLTNVKIKAEIPKVKSLEKIFDKIEEEKKITFKVSGLKEGKYKLKITMDYVIKNECKRVQKELILYVKEKEKKKIVQRTEIDELFGG